MEEFLKELLGKKNGKLLASIPFRVILRDVWKNFREELLVKFSQKHLEQFPEKHLEKKNHHAENLRGSLRGILGRTPRGILIREIYKGASGKI